MSRYRVRRPCMTWLEWNSRRCASPGRHNSRDYPGGARQRPAARTAATVGALSSREATAMEAAVVTRRRRRPRSRCRRMRLRFPHMHTCGWESRCSIQRRSSSDSSRGRSAGLQSSRASSDSSMRGSSAPRAALARRSCLLSCEQPSSRAASVRAATSLSARHSNERRCHTVSMHLIED
jgi:hypothetical protein